MDSSNKKLKVLNKAAKLKQKRLDYLKKRTIILIHNVPHGFYENELKKYFSQFGTVTRTRVVRSKRTGVSRNKAYVEFINKKVAEIAAKAMNNYLMLNNVLKISVIPPEKNHGRFFAGRNMTPDNYAGKNNRKKLVERFNKLVDKETEDKELKKMAKHLKKIIAKVHTIVPDFQFKPVDVPDFLNID